VKLPHDRNILPYLRYLRHPGKLFQIIVLLSLFAPLTTSASNPMVYIYNSPESRLDVRYLYHWEILKTALDKKTNTALIAWNRQNE